MLQKRAYGNIRDALSRAPSRDRQTEMEQQTTHQFKTAETRVNRWAIRRRLQISRPAVIAAIIVAVLIGFFIFRHRSQAQAARAKAVAGPPAIPISTATVWKGDIGVYVNALGLVTPLNTVMVKSRVDGQLVKVSFVEGQFVHAGDPLVEVDPAPFAAALTQAEGQLARDTALLENARLDLQRYQEAFARNAIPKQQLDTQAATVHQFEGTVEFDRGVVENARVQLAYCHITAPLSGRVGLRQVDPGNIVHANDSNALVVITEVQPIDVVFSLAEDYLPQVLQQLRQGKRMAVDGFDRAQLRKLASGTLLTIDNQIDTSTGTVKLKAEFPNEDEVLFPNQFVNVRLLVDTKRDATLVPSIVIQRNAEGAFVYLLKQGDTVAAQTVQVGVTDGNTSSVEGIEPGVVVAADNFNRLTDGAKVTVRQAPPEAKPKGGA